MRHCKVLLLTLGLSVSVTISNSQVSQKGYSLAGVFDGRTPCQELANQIGEKVTAECIKIKWRLFLYQDSITGKPCRYELIGFVYKKGNPRVGEWNVIKGTRANPEAIVYELKQEGAAPLLLLKGDDNVLFFLDKEKDLLVGNRDFSFTLNRVNKSP